jgi:type IV pilus assembly protein PilA
MMKLRLSSNGKLPLSSATSGSIKMAERNRFSGIFLAAVLFFSVHLSCDAQNTDLARRVAAEEASCAGNLRAIFQAQIVYRANHEERGFARSLSTLGPEGDGLISTKTAVGERDNYKYALRATPSDPKSPAESFSIVATPVKRLTKEQKGFYIDETGVVRWTSAHRRAKASDPPLN